MGLGGHTREIDVAIPEGDPPPYAEGVVRPLTGGRSPRVDGPLKVTGHALFTVDVRLPGMLHGRIVRSPYARARVVFVDTTRAAAIPGVVFEETGKKQVRYHGEAVLALAAPTAAAADDAVRATTILYEPLSPVLDLDQALAPGAPLVWEKPVGEKRTEGDAPSLGGNATQEGNRRSTKASVKGDPDRGFAEADATIEVVVSTQVQTHVSMETHALVADWRDGELHVFASTQGVFSVRDELARVFGVPREKVVVRAPFVGGGFGSKFGAGDYGVLAARLSRKAGKPVRMVLDRREEFLAAGNRPSCRVRMRLGYRGNGTVTTLHYISEGTAGVATGAGTGGFARSAYGFPNVRIEESDVFTHLGPGCAMRAPGHPQGCFAVETALEELAERLAMDPLALRLANDPSEVRRHEWELGRVAIGWERRAAISEANRKAAASGFQRRRGLGCAASVWYKLVAPGSQVVVRVHRDGGVEVENGVQDIGGGIRTVIGLVVAEELGLSPAAITVKIGDTRHPFGPGSGGSMTTGSLVPAVRAAAVHAAARLRGLAAPLLGARQEEITLRAGELVASGKSITWKRACARMAGDHFVVTGDRAQDYEGTDPRIFGAQFAEVEVDVETGIVWVAKVVAVQDCGQPVWLPGVENQIRGGILQGISYALFEERRVDRRTGRVLNPNLETYRVLGSRDVPEIVPIVVDLWCGNNNGHVRGIGEPATVPTAAAVANAVSHALGVRMTSLPLTPQKVLAAVASRRKEVHS